MIEIARIYVVTGLSHSVFIETIESVVSALVNMLEQPGVSFRAVSYEERESMGYDFNQVWSLEVIRPGEHFAAPVHDLCCMDRTTLETIALKISRVMPSYSIRLNRWARIRWIMIDRKKVKEFTEVPYIDKTAAEWV